jgi:Xaa-Pro dipeptidase
MALNPGPSLTYLTGLHFHLSERPVVGLFSPEKPPVIVLPELESGKLKNLDYPCLSFPYGEDPAKWPAAFARGLEEAGLTNHTIGIETRRMRLLEYYLIKSSAPQASFKPADEAIAEMRMKKDSAEASLMRTAVKIAQEALQNVLQSFKVEMSEREFASELTMQLLRLGSDPEFPFSPIVSGGPNSANPHAVPSDRPIQLGDLRCRLGAASTRIYLDITDLRYRSCGR